MIVMKGVKEGKELSRNAKKWSNLDTKTMKENGTSSVNLTTFAKEILFGYNEF